MLSHECQVTYLGLSHASHVVCSPNFLFIIFIFSCCQGNQILQCYNAHNSYLFSIQAYNSRCEQYYKNALPEMMDVSCCEVFIVCELLLLICLFTCLCVNLYGRMHIIAMYIRTYVCTYVFVYCNIYLVVYNVCLRTTTSVQCLICYLFVLSFVN